MNLYRKCAALVGSDQDLKEPMCNELVKVPEFFVGFKDAGSVLARGNPRTVPKRCCGFRKNRVGHHLAGHLPQGDEAVDSGGKGNIEDAIVRGSAGRFKVEIERPIVVVSSQEHEDVEPVEGVDEADGDVDIVLEAVAIVDVEVEELIAEEGAGERGTDGAAPHEFVEVFGIETDHIGVFELAGKNPGEHCVGGGEENFRLRLKGLGFHAMEHGGAAFGLGNFNVGFAGGVHAFGEPLQGLHFIDNALELVAEGAGPVDDVRCSEFMANGDGVAETPLGVVADFQLFSGGTTREDGVVEGFGCDHRTLEAVLFEAGVDLADDGVLPVVAERVVRENIGIVSGPVIDTDLREVLDDGFKVNRLAGGGMEDGMAFVSGRPLGAGDEVLAAAIGRVRATAGGGEAGDECALLVGR